MKRWMSIRRRKWLFALLGLLPVLVALLAVLLHDLARQALDWLLFAYQIGLRYVETWPQQVLWALLVILVLAVLLGRLFGWSERRRAARQGGRPRRGLVAEWAQWTTWAAERSTLRQYYRWRLARELAMLATDVLAHTRRISLAQARHLLEHGEVEAPAEVRAYLQAGRGDLPEERFLFLGRLLDRRKASPLELDPARVVDFL